MILAGIIPPFAHRNKEDLIAFGKSGLSVLNGLARQGLLQARLKAMMCVIGGSSCTLGRRLPVLA